MDRKYYTGEQILDALSEVGVGAGDIFEVMSCLGRMSLNNNSTKVDRKNDNLIRRQDAIDAMYDLVDGTERPESQKGNPHIYQIVDALERVPSAEPYWNEMIVICDNCGHVIRVKRIEEEGK